MLEILQIWISAILLAEYVANKDIIKKLIYETKKYISASSIKYRCYGWCIITTLELNLLAIKKSLS